MHPNITGEPAALTLTEALDLSTNVSLYGKRVFWTLVGCGFVTNFVVACVLIRIWKTHCHLQPVPFLFGICVADNIGLFCGLMYQELSAEGVLMFQVSIDPRLLTIICRVMVYLIHVVTAFSGFAFLLLATWRYVAVFHPSFFRRNERYLKKLAFPIGMSLIVLCAEKIWVPFSFGEFEAGDIKMCLTMRSNSFSPLTMRLLCTVDVALIFVTAVIASIFLDIVVYRNQRNPSRQETLSSTGPSSYYGKPSTQSNVENGVCSEIKPSDDQVSPVPGSARLRRKQERCNRACKLLWRYLILNALELVLGSAHYMLRLTTTFGYPQLDQLSPVSFLVYICVCEVAFQLYYVQFSCNWLYLWVLWPVLQEETQHKFSRRATLVQRTAMKKLVVINQAVIGYKHRLEALSRARADADLPPVRRTRLSVVSTMRAKSALTRTISEQI